MRRGHPEPAYHFGDEDGQRQCAEAVRASPGLVAARDQEVAGFLTVAHQECGAYGYQRTRAFYRSVGFLPARELPDLWPGNKALLLVLPLDG